MYCPTFLGGLSIGNYFFGKKAEKLKNHIFVYAVLELLVGIYCLIYPSLSLSLGESFISISVSAGVNSQNILFTFFRFLFASVLLILPTIAMGGTLPIISKFFIKKLSNTRKEIGILYFLNSFGAIWGIILSGFYMIKLMGLDNTMYFTAFINILIGIFALVVSRFNKIEDVTNEEKSEEEEKQDIKIDKSLGNILLLIAGLSGAAALLYELVWVRLLVNYLGSSTYAFSIMLLAFISGITLGSFIVSQEFIKKYNKVKMVMTFQACIAITTMISLMFYERFPYWLWKISSLFVKNEATFELFLTIEFLMCFTLLIIPTIFMGMTLPVIVDLISNSNNKVGYSVGKVFSINTVGTVIGVLITSLFFIPTFGVKTTFEIGIVINIISFFIILLKSDFIKKEAKISYGVTVVGVFILFILLFPEWNVNTIVNGVFRKLKQEVPKNYDEYQKSTKADSVLYFKEGITANVAVTTQKNGDGQKRLIINGKTDASTKGDLPTQVLLGQVPAMLKEDPKNAFVVGFGSGSTIATLLTHPIEKITCAEMSKEVIEAAPFFSEVNNNCLEDERVEVIIEDALTLLKLSEEKYDLIISEPSNPWIAGIGNLFSEEYFRLCLNRLNDDGVMVQWFHAYEVNDEVLQLVLSTFKYVFSHAQVWGSLSTDILLVGSKQKNDFNYEKFVERFNEEKIKKSFESIGVNNPFTFFTLQNLTNEGLFRLTNYKIIKLGITSKVRISCS